VNAIQTLWNRLQPGAKLRLAAGVLLIVGLGAWAAVVALRPQYDVLFARLTDADAASIVDQLKRQKLPYRLADNGATIEVPAEQVHETRLQLMSAGVPISGVVGFEIFDKQSLGVTDQSQRVSYQRALQGELARTIGALEDVKQARVHLVLPDSTLFKRDRQEARAAVSLTVKNGATLSHEQILGVQRLVAASVAGLDAPKVVITDQRGITLSGDDSMGVGAGGSGARLAMKREIEDYVSHKVAKLLDSAYGPGQAIVSVDVALNFDEIKRTVQDLLPVRGGASIGVRHKHEVVAGGGDSLIDEPLDKEPAGRASNSTTDVDYEYGRSLEQVIAAPGGITRLSVGVIVPGELAEEKQKRITDLVRMAAGINESRGDAIVVQPLDQLGIKAAAAFPAAAGDVVAPVPAPAAAEVAGAGTGAEAPLLISPRPLLTTTQVVMSWTVVVILLVALGFVALLRRKAVATPRLEGPAPLSNQERQQLLLEIRRVLGEGVPLTESRARS
jgi:flagellar M-ring protein FliF